MKKYLLTLALIAGTTLGAVSLRAEGTNAPAAPAAPALPAASIDQRIAALEAYIGNGDPAASLTKDTNGNLTVTAPATVGVAGPGHNAWMMTSAALVLFMTLRAWRCSTAAWCARKTSCPWSPNASASPVW